MTEEPREAEPLAGPLAEPRTEANWKLRLAALAVVVALLAVTYLLATTLVPRWWAHRVGDRVDGSMTAGFFYGLFLGFVFTLVPLVVARQALRRLPTQARVLLVVVALGLALPNLMTLSIVLGNGKGAHAGDRILDTEGTGFRSGSAWGAALALVAMVVLVGWLWRWRRDRRELKSLRAARD